MAALGIGYLQPIPRRPVPLYPAAASEFSIQLKHSPICSSHAATMISGSLDMLASRSSREITEPVMFIVWRRKIDAPTDHGGSVKRANFVCLSPASKGWFMLYFGARIRA